MRFRRFSRKVAFFVLYRWDVRNEEPRIIEEEVLLELKPTERAKEYAQKLLKTIFEKLPEIDVIIEEHLVGWSLDRLGTVERALLRLGVGELLFLGVEDPGRAFIDYVDIAKEYVGERGAKFINGVLSKIYRDFVKDKVGEEPQN